MRFQIRGSKIKDINKIKSIIQGALANEVDSINSLRFSVDNQEALKEQVRKRALDDVELQASKISEQLGISLGKIISFNESFVMPQFHIKNSEEIYEEDFQDYLDLGKIKVSVDVTYEIKQLFKFVQIISWNINGLRSAYKKGFLNWLKNDYKIHL